MQYFPENTTSTFITELPQTLSHGKWEVALFNFSLVFLTYINFSKMWSDFFIRQMTNLRWKVVHMSWAKYSSVQYGIFKNIKDLILVINRAYKDSHFVFELQNSILVNSNLTISCDDRKM